MSSIASISPSSLKEEELGNYWAQQGVREGGDAMTRATLMETRGL
jgi:hypothetical protein